MLFIIFVVAVSFSFRDAASAAGCRERSWAEARDTEPMASPAAATTAAATNEVTNSLLLFKIRAFESIHLNLIVYPSKMMCLRCDSFLNHRPAPSSSVIEPDSDGYGRRGTNTTVWSVR